MAEDQSIRSGELALAEKPQAPQVQADQQAALESLLEGNSVSESARRAGISRTTLYHWLREDAVFQAHYNRWRAEIREDSQMRLLALTRKAAEALEKALDAGDAKAALTLFKSLGLLTPQPEGCTDASELAQRMALQRRKRQSDLLRDQVNQEEDEESAKSGL